MTSFVARLASALLLCGALGGCAVVTVAGAAVGVAATAAGVVVNTTVGAARTVGSAVGSVAGGDAK